MNVTRSLGIILGVLCVLLGLVLFVLPTNVSKIGVLLTATTLSQPEYILALITCVILARVRCRASANTSVIYQVAYNDYVWDEEPDLEGGYGLRAPFPPPPKPPDPPAPSAKRHKKQNKRPKVATVRKGCIVGKGNRKDYKKPGPVMNPNSIRNIAAAGFKERGITLMEKKVSQAQCIWWSSEHGGHRTYWKDAKAYKQVQCCKRKDCYRVWRAAAGGEGELASKIAMYRTYYATLDQEQKEAWWASHSIYSGYKQKLGGKALKKHGKFHTFICEQYEDVSRMLVTGKIRLGGIEKTDMIPCCVEFLCFLTGGHHGTKDRRYIRRNALHNEHGAEAEELDISVPYHRAPRMQGESDKSTHARAWLKMQGALALHDPQEDHAILPWRTCEATHSYYVFQFEAEEGMSWAPSVDEAYKNAADAAGRELLAKHEMDVKNRKANLEDEQKREELSESELKALEDADIARKKQESVKWRYGNKRCGPKNPDQPEHPLLCSSSTFNKIWRTDNELVKIICREHLPFAKCNVCIANRQKNETKRTKEQVKEDQILYRAHLDEVKAERLYYYSNRMYARKFPKEFLSIIIDGADQSKHDLPHFRDRSHCTSEAKRLKMHLYGALVHGVGAYAFTVPDHEHQGHNTTIQVLHEILAELRKQGELPRVLKLQLDNTTKQNKGQFLYGYLALLVECGVFETVEVSFLPVGHTHEDIDQMFSRIAVYLRTHDCFCREDLRDAIRASYTNTDSGMPATVRHWDTIANISAWLRPYTANFASGCTQFRHVRIFRSVTDQSVWLQCASKMSSWGDPEDEWRGMKPLTTHTVPFNTGFGIPNLWTAFLGSRMPHAAKRSADLKDIDEQERSLNKIHKLYPKFGEAALEDCKSLLKLSRTPARPFPWKRADIETIFSVGPGAGAKESVARQQQAGLPLGEEGACYLVKPKPGEKDKFLLGIVRTLFTRRGESGVTMQWFKVDAGDDADVYTSAYTPVLALNTRYAITLWSMSLPVCLKHAHHRDRMRAQVGPVPFLPRRSTAAQSAHQSEEGRRQRGTTTNTTNTCMI